jgi:hypothetical protein
VKRLAAFGAAMVVMAQVAPACADLVMREADAANIRLGQRVFVDDGTCPQGQIKLLTGAKLNATRVLPTKQCVDRKGIKR